ncbi:phosphatases II [Pelomyxa schiedti]|nr:phosphatases II [Pelomyxa schiedti]
MSALHCFFCGGSKCKYEDYLRWVSVHDTANAIEGLFSNWITDDILATARPSSSLIRQYDIVNQFLRFNIRAVVNLQLPGEHASCGDRLVEGGFSYDPQEFMNAGIYFYSFGWPDMSTPDLSHALDIVQVMCFELSRNSKVAIHCHAGLGRTGLVISCFLVYSKNISAEQAISQVRLHRPRSIQTKKQTSFVKQFELYLNALKKYFPATSLSETLANQRRYLHGAESRRLSKIPKFIDVICARASTLQAHPPTNILLPDANCTGSLLKNLYDTPSSVLEQLKDNVNQGDWESLACVNDFTLLWQLVLEWLRGLQQPLIPARTTTMFDTPHLSLDAIVPTEALPTVKLLCSLLLMFEGEARSQSAQALAESLMPATMENNNPRHHCTSPHSSSTTPKQSALATTTTTTTTTSTCSATHCRGNSSPQPTPPAILQYLAELLITTATNV